MAEGKYQKWLTPDGLLLLESWARNGLTMDQIAHNCGCSPSSLGQWRRDHPAISAALKKGKEVVDVIVENALYKRAVGYMYNEITREPVIDPETGERTLAITKTVTKEVVPDVTAQIFWLKNRKPEQWRDKRDVNATLHQDADFVLEITGQDNADA